MKQAPQVDAKQLKFGDHHLSHSSGSGDVIEPMARAGVAVQTVRGSMPASGYGPPAWSESEGC
jgi:hypothetical protein